MANIEYTDAFEQRLRKKLEEEYEQADRMVVWASRAKNPLKEGGVINAKTSADSIERLSEKAVVFQNDIIEKAMNGDPGVFDGFGPLIDADIKAGVLNREGFTDRPFNLQDYVQDFRTQLAALCSMYGFTFNLGVLHLNFSSGSGVSFGETFVSSIGSLKEHFEQMKEKQSKG